MSEGRIEAIWIKRAKGGPMDTVASAELITGRGIAGNANQGGRRQVTIIDAAAWERITRELGASVDPSARRANVTVRGVDLENSRGRVLRLGECRIRIYGETRPCELMDEAHAGLRAAMSANWGGGAFGEVLEGGAVKVGDRVSWEEIESTGSARI